MQSHRISAQITKEDLDNYEETNEAIDAAITLTVSFLKERRELEKKYKSEGVAYTNELINYIEKAKQRFHGQLNCDTIWVWEEREISEEKADAWCEKNNVIC